MSDDEVAEPATGVLDAFSPGVTRQVVERVGPVPTHTVTVDNYVGARAAIEPAALLWGTDLDVDRLEELNAEGRVAIEEEDDDLFIAVNQAFHHVVLAAMGSKTLGDTMDQLDAFLRLATLPILEHDPSFNRRFIEVNEHIVELVQSGDRQAASDYLQVQLMKQAEAIIEMIEKINNGTV